MTHTQDTHLRVNTYEIIYTLLKSTLYFSHAKHFARQLKKENTVNYIKTLQEIVSTRQLEAVQRETRTIEFRAHLRSSKFHPQTDGERGDLISTADVARWLDYINEELE